MLRDIFSSSYRQFVLSYSVNTAPCSVESIFIKSMAGAQRWWVIDDGSLLTFNASIITTIHPEGTHLAGTLNLLEINTPKPPLNFVEVCPKHPFIKLVDSVRV